MSFLEGLQAITLNELVFKISTNVKIKYCIHVRALNCILLAVTATPAAQGF